MLRWIILLAIGIRLAAWAVIPGSRFASDEESYYRAGVMLAETGQSDVFWPPVTPWLIAAVHAAAPAVSLKALRLLWIAMDVGCLVMVAMLARRLLAAAWPNGVAGASAIVTLATATYALYLPAISHAQFVTSETPALFQLLLVLVLLTARAPSVGASATAGVVMGTLLLTRPSLMPLLVLLPLVPLWWQWPGIHWQHAAAVIATGSLVVGAYVLHNRMQTGEYTIAHNTAYNLYIGNRHHYAEDLNLFSPRATPDQIAFRRAFARGEEDYPAQPPAVLQREALQWIAAHPGTFARRALGRLARVFAPKTDVLELAGGEAVISVWSPTALLILAAANLQWLAVLVLGVMGLLRLWNAPGPYAPLFTAAIAGAAALCVIAISKPRYAFVFEPLLMITAAWLVRAPAVSLTRLQRGLAVAVFLFLAWGWMAWAIFAVTSRS